MSFILTNIICKKVPEWNRKVHTENNLFELCSIHQVRHVEDNEFNGKGQYIIHKNKPFIYINQTLKREMKLWIGFHELGHHLLHYPCNHKFSKGIRRKMDREANFFAAIALIPTYIVKSKTFGEILEEYNYPKDLIKLRKEIWDAYKI